MEFLLEGSNVYILLAAIFGLFMAWGIGANDVANAMATSVGSKAITIKQALIIAAIFEFAGAYLAGAEVTETIRKGLVEESAFTSNPQLVIWGMLAALLAAGLWLLIATQKGWPVSTTHTIVGAVVGFAAVGVGPHAVAWANVGSIAISWIFSPLLAGIIAFAVFMSIQKLVINTPDPLESAKRFGPFYLFLVGFILSILTLKKGLKYVGINFSNGVELAVALAIGTIVALVGYLLINRVQTEANVATTSSEGRRSRSHYANVEKIFAVMMVFTASAMAFAHGSNDVANAVGPMAAVLSAVQTGAVESQSAVPSWVLFLGAVGIVIGLATLGYKVIETVGTEITELTPTRGFSAEFGTALTVVFASYTGIPISTTHTLVGAVLGVGIARGIAAINMRVMGGILLSWIVTLPAGAILSVLFFFMFKGMFG